MSTFWVCQTRSRCGTRTARPSRTAAVAWPTRAGRVPAPEDGWTATLGGSFSVGFEHEFQVPVLAIKVGEVRASVTQEFMGSIGRNNEHSTSTTESEGVGFGSQAFGQGAVCYTQTSYRCYTYELAKPGSTITTTAQACVLVPTAGTATQMCSALEDWGTTEFKNTAGSSWTPIGHRPPNTTTISVDTGCQQLSSFGCAAGVITYRVWWVKKDADQHRPIQPRSRRTGRS